MKLQLTPQSLRLRLEEKEIQAFDRAGELRHTLALGPGPGLAYALQRMAPEAPGGLGVCYAAHTLVVELPAALARQLVEGTAVSLKGEAVGTDGQLIRIIVEKDLGPSH